MAQELKALNIPVINVSGIHLPGYAFPQVIGDLGASARMAVQHFMDRGFRHFAYFSLVGLSYVAFHQQTFAQAVMEAGGDFTSFAVKPRVGAEPDWNLDLAKVGDWLKSLPKPVALLTWNHSCAREIIYACQLSGILVPEEVAILSGSDDELFCELIQFSISGILGASEQIGYESAKLLDKLMSGQRTPSNPVLIPPLSIITRQSTDILAIRDQHLIKALGFIRENSSQPIQVSDVAKKTGLCRRALERRFIEVLGRTPAQELRRMRLEHAKNLLSETDMPVPEVADAAGFGSPEYLAYIFRHELGQTPLKFRKQTQSS
jgi:LacI family transcriptional regulator